MSTGRRGRCLRAAAICAALGAGLLLAGCATTAPLATSSRAGASHPPESSGIPATPQSVPTAAVISIASVDADGQTVSVAGFVQGVIEAGGACTFTLTPRDGGPAVTVASTGAENVTTTTCGTQQIAIGRFTSGAWTAELSYRSTDARVTSQPVEVEIP